MSLVGFSPRSSSAASLASTACSPRSEEEALLIPWTPRREDLMEGRVGVWGRSVDQRERWNEGEKGSRGQGV